jgi:hypothetical protein
MASQWVDWLIGVADLSVEFEARPKLYFSLEAFISRTYQCLDVDFSDDWARYEKELKVFDGRYVIIEGIFHYEPPNKMDVAWTNLHTNVSDQWLVG